MVRNSSGTFSVPLSGSCDRSFRFFGSSVLAFLRHCYYTYDLVACVCSPAFKAPKDPLRSGLGAALAGRLVRQTEQDGLKWDLLKQVLRVRTLLSGIGWLDLS